MGKHEAPDQCRFCGSEGGCFCEAYRQRFASVLSLTLGHRWQSDAEHIDSVADLMTHAHVNVGRAIDTRSALIAKEGGSLVP